MWDALALTGVAWAVALAVTGTFEDIFFPGAMSYEGKGGLQGSIAIKNLQLRKKRADIYDRGNRWEDRK